jgi:hypothetical protein
MSKVRKGARLGLQERDLAPANRDLLPLLELLAQITETVGSAHVDQRRLFGELAGHIRRVIDCDGVAIFQTVEGPEPRFLRIAHAEGLPVEPDL